MSPTNKGTQINGGQLRSVVCENSTTTFK